MQKKLRNYFKDVFYMKSYIYFGPIFKIYHKFIKFIKVKMFAWKQLQSNFQEEKPQNHHIMHTLTVNDI